MGILSAILSSILKRFSKYLIGALVLVCLACAGYAWYANHKLHSLKESKTVATNTLKNDIKAKQAKILADHIAITQLQSSIAEMQKTIKASEQSLKERQKVLDRIRKQKEDTHELLRKALKTHSDWANTAVPDSVRLALKESASNTPAPSDNKGSTHPSSK